MGTNRKGEKDSKAERRVDSGKQKQEGVESRKRGKELPDNEHRRRKLR